MIDLKTINIALTQLEEEKGISREKAIEAIEMSLAAAYKKEYGKKGQVVRAKIDMDSGKTDFTQIYTAVDETMVKFRPEGEESEAEKPERGFRRQADEKDEPVEEEDNDRVYFNEEHHMLIEDARKIKKDVLLEDELIFPLETKDDFGRIAAQTAKQVIIQKIREAEKESIFGEYKDMQGNVISGKVQRTEANNVFIDLGRTTAILPKEEQIPGERYRVGERIKAYIYSVEENQKGVNIRLSRSHPQFIAKLFETEAPEIANGVVEIKSIAREPGARTKIAVMSNEENIDPVGSCVGQRGVRVSTIINELGGEKIDIIEWSESPEEFITNAISPAKVIDVEVNEQTRQANIEVSDDQFSLAIGKGGQNVRLAAKLTGFRLDISSISGKNVEVDTDIEEGEEIEIKEGADIEDSNEEKDGVENEDGGEKKEAQVDN